VAHVSIARDARDLRVARLSFSFVFFVQSGVGLRWSLAYGRCIDFSPSHSAGAMCRSWLPFIFLNSVIYFRGLTSFEEAVGGLLAGKL
jgi:hypothetical protein